MATTLISFPDTLVTVLERVLVEHGSTAASDMLVNWLRDAARRQQDADAQDIFNKLTPAERDQFKARLRI